MARLNYEQFSPGISYYDMLLEQMMSPRSGYAGKQENKQARRIAGEKEDEALRGQLGSRRQLREGEQLPEGSYTSVRNPFTWLAAQQAMGGAPPRRFGAVDIWSTPQERQGGADRNRQWGQNQLSLWGI
ncbi:hypothetical protein LCGC14_0344860 [marine sediment metagenome]|uniref:Uncharacterized protein n=1 Tax=marine sediment metagenome TaxID=412755 RepID=A0A0F9TCP3_9ZZZZ